MAARRKITVLFVNHVSQISGAEKSLMSLVQELRRSERHDYTLLAACPDGPLASELERAGVKVFPMPMPRFYRKDGAVRLSGKFPAWMGAVRELVGIVGRQRVDIIHANSAEAQMHAMAAARFAKVPSVWHARDLAPLSGAGRLLGRGAAKVIAISDAVAACLVAQGVPRKRVVRIYNGIDVSAIQQSVGQIGPLDAPNSSRWIVMVAQLVPWKRHSDFIRAMAIIAPEFEEAHGLIVGADLMNDHPRHAGRLKSLAARLGVGGRISFLGQRDDVASIVASSEMLVLPSEAEPFGRAALEAMALARPVVGTRAGGLPELVEDGETGLLVPVRKPAQLAEAIAKLLLDATRARQMGERGLDRAQRLFSARQCASEVERVYEEMLAAKPARRGVAKS